MSQRTRIVVTVLACGAAASLFARLLAHADAAATWRAASSAGPLIALALVPFVLGMILDSLGTVALLRALGARLGLAHMLPVRMATEALHLSVPAGFVASDTATAMLLRARADVPVRDGVVASIARRWLVMRAHGSYIVAASLLGFPALARLSTKLLGGTGLAWAVLGAAALPFAASFTLGTGLLGRSTFVRLQALLARVPSRRLARWVDARRSEAVATDAQVARLRAARSATTLATIAFAGCWCVEAIESTLILRILGADVALSTMMAIEAGVTLLRSLIVLAPSGLGVVDLGYAAVLPALGIDGGCASAFVLLKRGKELVWVLTGYVVLGMLRGRARPASAAAPLAGALSPELPASSSSDGESPWAGPGLRGDRVLP